ncbi:MAG: hypothetical protein N2253_05635 [Bacteroidia bacterium]|nr:hypothetical protein [Bacteroidia bacterium]MCX7764354.1 hypothetical protein [Bacteroidia bacterium]MDW8057287.1 hypothetical protein [Bacteroidia bacterium]
MSLMKQKRSEKFNPPTGAMKYIHRLIGEYFWVEAKLIPARWRGSSIIAIARPKR